MKTKTGTEIEYAAVVRIRKVGKMVQAMVIPIYYKREDGRIKKGNGLAVAGDLWEEKDLVKVEENTLNKFGKFPKVTTHEFKTWLTKCQEDF